MTMATLSLVSSFKCRSQTELMLQEQQPSQAEMQIPEVEPDTYVFVENNQLAGYPGK
jgi:hypothetical protein